MSFADDLRKATLTEYQLEAERLCREKREFTRIKSAMVYHLENVCRSAAGKAKREASDYLRGGTGDDPYQVSFNTKEEALKYAEAVKVGLIADGLTDIGYKVESIGRFSNKAYQVKFTIRW